jgi:hypothetical protein
LNTDLKNLDFPKWREQSRSVKVKRLIIALSAMAIALVVAWFFFFRNPAHTATMSESKPDQFGLQIGPATLGWSSHGEQDGFVYMRDVQPGGNNQPLWEFAPTPKQHFSEITRNDLKCEFYGMNDPRGSQIFGTAWDGSAVLIHEGHMFFARLASNPSTVYVIRLAKQSGHAGRCTIQIEYRVY